MIPLANVNACITNIGMRLQVTINNENKEKLDKYDRVFFVSVDGEVVFKELMLFKSVSPILITLFLIWFLNMNIS